MASYLLQLLQKWWMVFGESYHIAGFNNTSFSFLSVDFVFLKHKIYYKSIRFKQSKPFSKASDLFQVL